MKISTAEAGVDLRRTPRVFEQSFSLRHQYSVYFTTGLFEPENELLSKVLVPSVGGQISKVCAVIDDGLLSHYPDLLEQIALKASGDRSWQLVAAPLEIAGGETSKNDPEQLQKIYAYFERHGLDRHSYVLAVGGGAVVDAAGYAAATAHRGIRLVRVPTTVLGQNDSGVGVKNGVNFKSSKNFLGTFAPPWAVLNDLSFLRTLSMRDCRAGMAEAIKVSLIKDRDFFDWMEMHASELSQGEAPFVHELVERTAVLHMEHIATSGDPFESGSSRPLDFGHWVAHKLETLTQHALRHGEAVAIGIAMDTLYSADLGLISEHCARRVIQLVRKIGLPHYDRALELLANDGQALYLNGLDEFRQHLGGELNVTLLQDIGEGVQVHEMDLKRVERCRLTLAKS